MKQLVLIISLLLVGFQNGRAQGFQLKPIPNSLKGAVFAPAFYKNKLVVCSDQKETIYKTIKDKYDKETIDLYLIDPNDHEKPIAFDKMFKTDYHDGPITFDSSGTFAIVSQNLLTDLKFKNLQLTNNHLGLFYSNYDEGKWSDLKPLPFNDTAYNCTHPYLNEAGNILYFASNMPGGYGGYDLYKATLIDGKWSRPKNLGATVNTAKNEVFPSFDNGQIYFSSDRDGYGGLDIYVATAIGKKYKTYRLDSTLNSASDDFGLISKDKLETAYFTSNRSGIDRIYSAVSTTPVFNDCDTLVPTYLCYHFQEESAMQFGKEPGLVYYWNINGEKIEGVEIDYCFPSAGQYEITIDIVDTIVNATYYEQSYYFIEIEVAEQPYITAPDTVQIGKEFVLNAHQTNLPNLMIEDNDYYWTVGNHTYRGKEAKHTFKTLGEFEIELGVIGFDGEAKVMDCVYRGIVCADTVYTKPLSEDQDFLANKENFTIEEQHFFAVPGDTNMVVFSIEVARSLEELPPDHPVIKLFEKSDEIHIQYLEEEKLYLYLYGTYSEFEDALPDFRRFKEMGLEEAILRSFNLEDITDITLDEEFVFDNVQFESGKWDISENSEIEIQKIIEIMEFFPQLRLKISAFTDNLGSPTYNLELSEKRAKAVKDYMVANGIEGNRIEYEGYGENKPRDTNETEEGRQNNRRVEFELFKP